MILLLLYMNEFVQHYLIVTIIEFVNVTVKYWYIYYILKDFYYDLRDNPQFLHLCYKIEYVKTFFNFHIHVLTFTALNSVITAYKRVETIGFARKCCTNKYLKKLI